MCDSSKSNQCSKFGVYLWGVVAREKEVEATEHTREALVVNLCDFGAFWTEGAAKVKSVTMVGSPWVL